MGIFSWHFHRKMREPTIRGCSVPMLHACRDIDDITRRHTDWCLAPFLIKTSAGNADQNLTAAFLGVVDMPVITTPRLKSYIENAHLFF